jgi:hypothetical protein
LFAEVSAAFYSLSILSWQQFSTYTSIVHNHDLPYSFCFAAADSSSLKAIQAQPAAGKGLAFGTVQTALVGDAAALRKKFAAEHAAGL